MRDLAQSFGVAACGLVTSILTALAVVAVSRMTGFDFFTFSIWVVVPVGAALTGFAAASGYYFGSLYFHKRPDLLLLLQMVVIAGLTQLLIYYLGYRTFVLDDGRRVSDLIPFGRYLDIILTSAHYRVGRAMTDTGEVGSFGYWLAAFQFVGFLVGGLCVYGFLRAKPVCSTCNLYLRPLSKREKTFADADSASSYYDVLFQHPVDSSEFASLIRADAKAKAAKGAVLVKTILHGCPKCKAQLIEENVQVHNGSEWKDADKLGRRVAIPGGVDLITVFRP
jgi:hypothetical protein